MKQMTLLIILLSFLSCEKEGSNFKDVDVTSLETELACFACKLDECSNNCEFVINDNDSYLLLDSLKSDSEDCNSSQLPDIDFNKKTLIGKCTLVSGCGETKYSRKVEISDSDRKYIYTIQIDTSGLAHCIKNNMNWILVPKIPSNYSIEFKVITK
jgi:hypothetical protein